MNHVKPLFLLAFLYLIAFQQGSAQNLFMQLYGDTLSQRGGHVVLCPDGGYAIAGTSPGFNSMDFYLVRTDAWGNFRWARTYPNNDTIEVAHRLILTQEGGFAIVGTSSMAGSIWREDFSMLVTDSLGNLIFQDTYGVTGSFTAEHGYDLVQTPDSGFAFIGASFQQSGTTGRLYKLDGQGNFQWGKAWSPGTVLFRIEETADGGYIIAASYNYFSTKGLRLIKTDSAMNTQWSQIIRSSLVTTWSDHRPKGVVQLADGGYFTAVERYICNSCPNNADLWLVRTDSLGDTLWTRSIDGVEDYFLHDAIQTLDGNYTLVGYTRQPAPSYQIDSYIMKLDTGGNILWRNPVPGNQLNYAQSVVNHPDSGTVIGGYTWTIDGQLLLLTIGDTCCLPIPIAAHSSGTSLCPGDSLQLWADTTGYPVVWSTGDTSLSITVTQPGNYYYSLIDSLGCPSRSTEVVITASSIREPGFTLIGNDTLCPGDTARLVIDSTYSGMQWSTGATQDTLLILQPGAYFATNIGACGPAYSDTIQITQLTNPAVSAGQDQDICLGDTLLLLATGAQSYQWTSNATLLSFGDSAYVFPASPTTYSVSGSNSFGCTDEDSLEVVPHALPTVQLGSDTLMCTNQSLTLQAGSFSSYFWSDGSTQSSLLVEGAVTGAGTFLYWVDVTDMQGCMSRDSLIITVDVCVGLNESDLAEHILLTPNPVMDNSILSYSGNKRGVAKVSLSDLSGRQLRMWDWEMQEPLPLTLDKLEGGLYWLTILQGNERAVIKVSLLK